MTNTNVLTLEARDVERVNTALRSLPTADPHNTQSLLLEVVENTPDPYVYQFERDGASFIKFWDKEEFAHYVLWQKQHGVARPITWIGSAYPRAYYYLGFLKVKTREYEEAVAFLDRGRGLEPTSPKFNFEKAQALVSLKRHQEALALYEAVNTIGPHVSPHELAVAYRGRGFVLIEMGEMDRAEAAFRRSLETEPDNKVALNELRYIAHLRGGGTAAPTDVVPTLAPPANKCATCGQLFTTGHLEEMDGRADFICKKCRGKRTKQWWQFWK